jgi:hypothetical protein
VTIIETNGAPGLRQSMFEIEGLDVEGLDDTENGDWSEYSIDSVFVRNETRSVSDMIRRIDQGRCVLDPEFQRDFVWPEDKQSKLIQSSVMRIPLPVFYLAAAPDGKIIIVDGLQRLTTFHRFVKGEFKLKGLKKKDQDTDLLEGKNFGQLEIPLQERILDTQLITYILDANAPERARLDIFERVNSGVPLTRQQMRNALYSGPATIWLKEAAAGFPFRSASGGGLDPKMMRDREAINRFCAFFLIDWTNYKSGEMDSFLARALMGMNKLSTTQLTKLRTLFDASMRLNREIFGDHAFRKSLATSGSRRQVLNIALFDVCSVNLARFNQKITGNAAAAEKVRNAISKLITNPVFVKSITYSTNSTNAVTTRFKMTEEALEAIL